MPQSNANQLKDLEKDTVFGSGQFSTAEEQTAYKMSFAHGRFAGKLMAEVIRHEEVARTDALTGLPNRRALEEIYDRMRTSSHRRASDTGKKDCVAFIDLDKFKSVNDIFGHAIGDALLQDVAEKLQRGVRHGDTVGRLGGDEFMVILPSTSNEDALTVAERLRASMDDMFLGDIAPRLSIGVSTIDPDLEFQAMYVHADNAMYEAKHQNGGNNVVMVES